MCVFVCIIIFELKNILRILQVFERCIYTCFTFANFLLKLHQLQVLPTTSQSQVVTSPKKGGDT